MNEWPKDPEIVKLRKRITIWEKRWKALRKELREDQANGGGLVISWGIPTFLRTMTEITRKIK